MKRIERNKEGVPGWDGDAATYQEYAELAALWEQSVPYHKRYLCGPKLINELAGTARRFPGSGARLGVIPRWSASIAGSLAEEPWIATDVRDALLPDSKTGAPAMATDPRKDPSHLVR